MDVSAANNIKIISFRYILIPFVQTLDPLAVLTEIVMLPMMMTKVTNYPKQ